LIKNRNLNSKNSLFIVLFTLFISLVLFFPKIYLTNNIYYVSKDINRLYAHYISLKEENKFLAQQLEDMKFKNQIEDSLLIYSIEMQKNDKNDN
jgi:cell division protein FtsL